MRKNVVCYLLYLHWERSGVLKELEQPIQSIPKGRRFCTVCGEIKRETHFDGASTHCRACCEKMLHTHVHVYGVLVLMLMLALAAASAALGVQTVRFCRSLHRADTLAADKYLYDACDAYENVVADIPEINRALLPGSKADAESGEESAAPYALFEAGTHTWERYAAVYAKTQSDYEAASMLQSSLNADRLQKNAVLSAYTDAQTAYTAVSDAIDAYTQEHPYETIEDMPYDGFIELLDGIEAENDSRYYKGYAELFKGSATQYYKTDDPTASFVYYDKALEYLPDEYGNIYTSKAEAAREAEDWDALRQAGEAIIAQNKNYTEAYEWIARAAAKKGDMQAAKEAAELLHAASPDSPLYEKLLVQSALIAGDADAAQKTVAAAEKTIDVKAAELFSTLLAKQTLPTADQRFLREYTQYASVSAVVHLLTNDAEKIAEYAYERGFNYAYYLEYLTQNSAITQLSIDIASIYANLYHDEDAINALSQIGGCSDDAQKVIDGKLTPEQAFLKGEADLL